MFLPWQSLPRNVSPRRNPMPQPPLALAQVLGGAVVGLEEAGLAVLAVADAVERPRRGLRRDITTIRT